MPRDLSALANKNTLSTAPEISKSPEPLDRGPPGDADDDANQKTSDPADGGSTNQLHPYTQTLSLADVESCVRLEEAAFPPSERATREKFQYRLRHCGELSMGIFNSQVDSSAPTAESSAPVYSGTPERKAVLLGHVVSTKTTNFVVTDDDMAIPGANNEGPKLGHKDEGRTVCIHSVAILPEYQKCGLGSILMKAYIQRIESHGVADRLALISHDHLVPWYEKLGFKNKGKSTAQFGGGGWYDMIKELTQGHTGSS